MKNILVLAILLFSTFLHAGEFEMTEKISSIQKQWAIIRYQMVEERKADAYEALALQSGRLAAQFPDRAEPLIWNFSEGHAPGAWLALAAAFIA